MAETELKLFNSPDAKEAAHQAAHRIVELAVAAVAERGSFSMAISGGKTHWLMLAIMSTHPEMPWDQTQIFQVDERLASPGSPDRNLTHLVLTLPIERQAVLKPMPVTRRDLEQAAAEYESELPERLDVVHLGLSAKGHTASLIPGDPVTEVRDRRVALTANAYEGHRRMTLTLQAINEARAIVWLVTGNDKMEALKMLLDGDPSIAASQVNRENACVYADSTATGEGSPTPPADLWQQGPA